MARHGSPHSARSPTSKTTTKDNDKRSTRFPVNLLSITILIAISVAVALLFVPTSPSLNSVAISVGDAESAHGVSLCYNRPLNKADMVQDFAKIKERFTGVRTYETAGGDANPIDIAFQTRLTVHAGVWLQEGSNGQADIAAIVDGIKRNPSTVKSIFVGSENMRWSDRGHEGSRDQVGMTHFAQARPDDVRQEIVNQIKATIQNLRSTLRSAGITTPPPIGSAQFDWDWLTPEGQDLAAAVDVIGVNIHPFLGDSADSIIKPINDLDTRWNTMKAKFPSTPMTLTATGWPTNGQSWPLFPASASHIPNGYNAQQYAWNVMQWFAAGNGGDSPAYYAFADRLKYNYKSSGNPLRNFGVCSGDWRFPFAPPDPPSRAIANLKEKVMLSTTPESDKLTARPWINWTQDMNFHWVQVGSNWKSVAANKCLDAYEPRDGGAVHIYSCDGGNPNQYWAFDDKTQQMRHLTHRRFCLDVASENVALYTCKDVNDPTISTQQFELWV
ncbi:Aste57867_2260 [Aphanomyces stellatus]|uniref:glucan endo-1,3-beta-D-glucosidase n=1 Tax=Aphanomyces stellatus TaxID=120398 RepID=A0A485K7A6_9STRA|nr:hypothetical protein As57867_002255 [Aphanomyces stellatus]VFT79463.1 Aste57867_2260 [Aphanomyces stellatus]